MKNSSQFGASSVGEESHPSLPQYESQDVGYSQQVHEGMNAHLPKYASQESAIHSMHGIAINNPGTEGMDSEGPQVEEMEPRKEEIPLYTHSQEWLGDEHRTWTSHPDPSRETSRTSMQSSPQTMEKKARHVEKHKCMRTQHTGPGQPLANPSDECPKSPAPQLYPNMSKGKSHKHKTAILGPHTPRPQIRSKSTPAMRTTTGMRHYNNTTTTPPDNFPPSGSGRRNNPENASFGHSGGQDGDQDRREDRDPPKELRRMQCTQ